jgi:hypothetical protein
LPQRFVGWFGGQYLINHGPRAPLTFETIKLFAGRRPSR